LRLLKALSACILGLNNTQNGATDFAASLLLSSEKIRKQILVMGKKPRKFTFFYINAASGGTVAQNISFKKINFFKPPTPMSLYPIPSCRPPSV
jgi:hypothetical protein